MITTHINIEQLCGAALSRNVIAMSETDEMHKALMLEVSLSLLNPCDTITNYHLIIGDRGIVYTTTKIMDAIETYNIY